MKFRDPKTGEVFETIEKARKEYCEGKKFCSECQFSCLLFAERHPAEAARLMGYEVIDDTPTTLDDTPTEGGDRPTDKDNIVLGKPLREWTLGEIRKICDRSGCENCPFHSDGDPKCIVDITPNGWNLEYIGLDSVCKASDCYIHGENDEDDEDDDI